MVHTVVMARHGESEWNKENLFTGWYDSLLTQTGKEEARLAGEAIADSGIHFDVAHTSVLSRAQQTLEIILEECSQTNCPVFKTWRLNERHYGNLTGFNKSETAEKYGEEQVAIWRRSFDIPPPPMDCSNKYFRQIVEDPRYANDPPRHMFPLFESLKLCIDRTLPYWECNIVKDLEEGKTVFVCAHGNSLRGLVKHLEGISDADIAKLNLPTGVPFVYQLDDDMKPLGPMKFLGDPEAIQKAMENVANQGKAKQEGQSSKQGSISTPKKDSLPPPKKDSLPPIKRESLPKEETLPPTKRESLPKEESLPPPKRESLPKEVSLPPIKKESLPPIKMESVSPTKNDSLPPTKKESLPKEKENLPSQTESFTSKSEVGLPKNKEATE